MSVETLNKANLLKVMITFLIAGVAVGLMFAYLITRPSLNSVWFQREEFWEFPTIGFWLLTGCLFVAGLGISYSLAHYNNWISFSVYRLLLATLVLSAAPVLSWAVIHSIQSFQFVLIRAIVAASLVLALFVVTQRWRIGLGLLVVIIFFVSPLLAGLPDTFLSPFPTSWFEALRFMIVVSLLLPVVGYWLASSQSRGDRSQSTAVGSGAHVRRQQRGGIKD